MRMLGTMYYNGLNVPQDTKEGIRWYRKAAAAGSVAAAKDLEQLGLPVTDK
jgi:TPR repeat protein